MTPRYIPEFIPMEHGSSHPQDGDLAEFGPVTLAALENAVVPPGPLRAGSSSLRRSSAGLALGL